jgi:hypothetical protein
MRIRNSARCGELTGTHAESAVGGRLPRSRGLREVAGALVQKCWPRRNPGKRGKAVSGTVHFAPVPNDGRAPGTVPGQLVGKKVTTHRACRWRRTAIRRSCAVGWHLGALLLQAPFTSPMLHLGGYRYE